MKSCTDYRINEVKNLVYNVNLIQEILYEEMKNYYRSQDEKSAEKLNELHFPLHFYKI